MATGVKRTKVEVGNRCERCGHFWVQRKKEPPEVCPNPKCKSPYWNRPKVEKARARRRG